MEHRVLRGGLPAFFTHPTLPEREYQEWLDAFLLFGPRGTGKSTWLRQVLPGARKPPRCCLREQVLEELPDLEPDDVAGCLRFASQRLDHPVIAA